MNIRKVIIIIFSFFLFSSCKNAEKRKNEITKITLSTGLCYGSCPAQVIEIDSSLTVKYCGLKYAKLKGCYIGEITQKDWDSINSKFEKIKYKELDSVYDHSVDDAPHFLKIYYGNKIKRIRAQSASLPENVEDTYYWLIEVAKNSKLKKANDSLNFEKEPLKFMFPPIPPVPPKMPRE